MLSQKCGEPLAWENTLMAECLSPNFTPRLVYTLPSLLIINFMLHLMSSCDYRPRRLSQLKYKTNPFATWYMKFIVKFLLIQRVGKYWLLSFSKSQKIWLVCFWCLTLFEPGLQKEWSLYVGRTVSWALQLTER